MRTIYWILGNGLATCDRTGEVEVEDDATDEEIEAAFKEDMWNWLELSWGDEPHDD
jgi:hypothetical protein